MRVLFLILDHQGPSSRYRVLQYLPFLRGAGVETEVRQWPKGVVSRMALLRQARRFDRVLVQKRLARGWEWRWLRANAPWVAFDFDDAIVYRDSPRGATWSRGRFRRFRRIAGSCDLVIPGNAFLQALAHEHSARTEVIPTPIDMTRYGPKPLATADTVTIGWIGGAGTLFYLERLHPILRKLCRENRALRVRVVSNAFPGWDDLPLERVPWSYEDELRDLHAFDIGIMPLTDDPWARGKCGFKLLQYMAAGLPVVCSPVGVNREMVTHGVNGLLAPDGGAWEQCLRRLAGDREERRRMGSAGRRLVEESYSLAKWAPRLLRALGGSIP